MDRLCAVWVSHKHADHMLGLPGILSARSADQPPLLASPSPTLLCMSQLQHCCWAGPSLKRLVRQLRSMIPCLSGCESLKRNDASLWPFLHQPVIKLEFHFTGIIYTARLQSAVGCKFNSRG